jgi:dTDP-4-dehydrorhamnose 3,5-epimerase
MRVTPTALPEVLIIDPDVHTDARGHFLETWHATRYASLGIPARFVQDNQSRSVQGTVRGLHLQVALPQAKLIRVLVGDILDVAVDVRRGSPTFGKWVGVRLTGESYRQCYIPEGFAHGFSVLSPFAEIAYKCTDFYDPAGQLGLAWDDPAIGVAWQVDHPILSERDLKNPTLAQAFERLPVYGPSEL